MQHAPSIPVLAAALIALAAPVLAGCDRSREQDRAAIEREILATPRSEELWATIQREYPDDFARLVDRVQALDPDERRDPARGEAIGRQWLQDFFARIGPDAVKAPPGELLRWSAAEAGLYASLQRAAPEACAAMTMGEWIYVEEENQAAYDVIASRNIAMVRAAAAGREDPQDYAPPDEVAFARLGDAIAATGLAPELQEAMASEDRLEALGRDERCAVGVAFHRGIADLPDETEPQIAAYMLAPPE